MTVGIPDVERVVVVHRESGPHGEVETAPLFNKFSILIPDLNARVVVVTAQDNQAAFRVHLDPMYGIESARLFPLDAANDLDGISILREFDDAMLLVPIRDEDIPVGSNENVTRAITGNPGRLVPLDG